MKSQNDFTANPRLLCSFTFASVSCGFFVIRLRPRSGRWRWHSSVWKCGCHQHNSSVFTYDSLMNFDWDHFDVAGVTHFQSTSNEVGINFGGFQNSWPLNHTHTHGSTFDRMGKIQLVIHFYSAVSRSHSELLRSTLIYSTSIQGLT